MMVDLMLHLKVRLRVHFKEPLKIKDEVTKRMDLHLMDVLLGGLLDDALVSGIEGAPEDSSEGTSTFEVQIKGAFWATIELHLKMHMVVHLLVPKSAKNDSIKGELEGTLYVALEDKPKISL